MGNKKSSIQYRVPYADTDQMRMVYYAHYFVYFERLRNELIRDLGLSYADVEKDGLFFPVIEAFCEYLLPAVFDDLLTVTGWVAWVQGSRFQIDYEIFRDVTEKETPATDADVLVRGRTIHNVMNSAGNSRRVPGFLLGR